MCKTKQLNLRTSLKHRHLVPGTILLKPRQWDGTAGTLSERTSVKMLLKRTADAMVTSGLKEVGFEYIVIDDIWQGGRDSVTGLLFPDPKRFPSGIKALADYVHGRGLKFGIYSDAGTMTCGDRTGEFWVMRRRMQRYLLNGVVDYLKYDYCYCPDYGSENNDYKMAITRYKAIG